MQRYYYIYLNHFTQPDSIVPDPYNSQDWDRYAYVRGNPIKYTDPTGHSVDCGMGDAFCSAGKYTPNGLINLYKHYYGRDALNRPYNEPNVIRDKLSKEIEDYLVKNSDYKMSDDISSSTNYGTFSSIREDYWRDRCMQASGCDLLYDPARLYRYYDLHENIQFMRFDPSLVDWTSTGLDSASLVLSVISLGAAPKSAKTVYTSYGSQLLGGTSGAYSFANEDDTGGWLSVAGFLPPPFGTIASGSSVVRDLSAGVYYVPYVPSIPR